MMEAVCVVAFLSLSGAFGIGCLGYLFGVFVIHNSRKGLDVGAGLGAAIGAIAGVILVATQGMEGVGLGPVLALAGIFVSFWVLMSKVGPLMFVRRANDREISRLRQALQNSVPDPLVRAAAELGLDGLAGRIFYTNDSSVPFKLAASHGKLFITQAGLDHLDDAQLASSLILELAYLSK